MRRANKPKNLKDKMRLAELIRLQGRKIVFRQHERGHYWTGAFWVGDRVISVFWQNYVTRPGQVDYVRLRWNGAIGETLTRTEIKDLLQEFDTKAQDRWELENEIRAIFDETPLPHHTRITNMVMRFIEERYDRKKEKVFIPGAE